MSTLTVRSLTFSEVNAMDSKTYDWHFRNNRRNLDAAVTPPAPPPPVVEPTAPEKRAAIQKDYQAWRKKNGIDKDVPKQEELDAFLAERNLPQVVAADQKRWKQAHPEID